MEALAGGQRPRPMSKDALSPEDTKVLARGLLDALPGGVVHIHRDGSIAAANAEALRILGRDFDDLLQRHLSHCHVDMVDESGHPCSFEALPAAKALATGEPQPGVTLGIHRPDGSTAWAVFRATPIKDPHGGEILGAIVTFLDITERKRTEQELRRNQDLLRKSEELAHVGTWEWDLTTGSVRWTDQLYAIYGRDPAHPVTHADEAFELIHPDDREHARLRTKSLFEGHDEGPAELRIRSADGKEKVIWGSAEVVRDHEGRPVKALGAVQDVTDRHALETQLRQTQRLESVGQLAAGIAHDFNNLMQPILGYADLILKGGDPKAAAAEIRRAAERGADLTRQLLAFGRRQPFRPVPLDPNDIVSSFAGLMRRVAGNHVEVEVDLSPEVAAIPADRGQIEQVLMNLGINARDAMPSGGRLTLRTRTVDADDPLLRQHGSEQQGEFVEITVADTGEGMDDETRARIFEPFFTTKGPGAGTGLGLSVVYGILQRHGGFIAVESRPEEGTTFRVYLPAFEGAAASHTPPESTPPITESQRGTLLVVEDDDAVRRITVQLLSYAGYRVLAAANADEAMVLFEAHQAEVDAVFTDIRMPGCDGPALVQRLHQHKPSLRVVYTTGYAAETSEDLGSHTVLHKPYDADALLTTVRRVLDA
jgi:two-component system, cell cycle sensor histidine kinase and response regulator CckA